MAKLARLVSREVLDSRGNPTVEVEAIADNGAVGRAIVPAGASRGRHEAVELRDEEMGRYSGRGVRQAVLNVAKEIAPVLGGTNLDDQESIDSALIALDGTPNKSRLGANSILGVSLACAHAAAASRGESLHLHLHRLWRQRLQPGEADAGPLLPLPMVNVLSGGLHAGRRLDVQDFQVMAVGAHSFREAMEMTAAVYHALGGVLKGHGEDGSLVGDEGGYGPQLESNAHGFERVLEAIEAAGLRPGTDVAIALDVAASHFHQPATGRYRLHCRGGEVEELDSAAIVALMEDWARQYPALVSLEDALSEDDWEGWELLTARLGDHLQLIGDDLFCTQTDRIMEGIHRRVANSVLVKVNQVGTLSESLNALLLAKRNGYRAVVSARSGETEDTTIADLAVATGAGQIKIGALARSERLAKYNRLLRIEEELGGLEAPYAGRAVVGT